MSIRPINVVRTLNIAMIGSRFMGRVHSNAYVSVPKFFDLPLLPVMHTVAARDEEALVNFAGRWGWHNTTIDWRLAVENP
jgi:predicted dehydrogenase